MIKNKYVINGNLAIIYVERNNGDTLEVLIDAVNLEKLFSAISLSVYKTNSSGHYIAARYKNRVRIALHRLLVNAPDGYCVDHINHNTLDNRMENLRIATTSENAQNRKGAQRNSKSGIRGVCLHKNGWLAYCRIQGRLIYLGLFSTAEKADEVVKDYRRKHMPYSYKDIAN